MLQPVSKMISLKLLICQILTFSCSFLINSFLHAIVHMSALTLQTRPEIGTSGRDTGWDRAPDAGRDIVIYQNYHKSRRISTKTHSLNCTLRTHQRSFHYQNTESHTTRNGSRCWDRRIDDKCPTRTKDFIQREPVPTRGRSCNGRVRILDVLLSVWSCTGRCQDNLMRRGHASYSPEAIPPDILLVPFRQAGR